MGPRAGSRRSGCARAAPARGAWTSGAASVPSVRRKSAPTCGRTTWSPSAATPCASTGATGTTPACIPGSTSSRCGRSRQLELRRTEALARAAASYAPALVSVAVVDLETGAEAFAHADERVHAASTFKVAVLMAAHQLAAAGELRLDERIVVENRFASLVAGEFAVAEEDLDHWTHAQLGRSVPLSALLERMIVLTRGFARESDAFGAIRAISRLVWGCIVESP